MVGYSDFNGRGKNRPTGPSGIGTAFPKVLIIIYLRCIYIAE
jgi:hypothetical protein